MEMTNFLLSSKTLSKDSKLIIYKMISPFSPHLGEELWATNSRSSDSVFESGWPNYEPGLIIDSTINVAVQVNGKLRGSIEIDKNLDKESVISLSREIDNVKKYIDSGNLVKEIYVPGKIVNFVIK